MPASQLIPWHMAHIDVCMQTEELKKMLAELDGSPPLPKDVAYVPIHHFHVSVYRYPSRTRP
jgi:hypothetical protein